MSELSSDGRFVHSPPACLVPNPLISRNKPLVAVAPEGSRSSWLALAPGVGPRRVLVNWSVPRHDGAITSTPASYRLETSSDSKDGCDGNWREELAIAANTLGARQHELDFDGQSWLRFRVDDGAMALELARFDVHDASDGSDDSWLFIAEPGTPNDAQGSPSFAQIVHERYPGYFPALLALGDVTKAPSAAELAHWLAENPKLARVLIAGGCPASVAAWLQVITGAGRAALVVDSSAESVQCVHEGHILLPAPPEHIAASAPLLQRFWADSLDFLYAPV